MEKVRYSSAEHPWGRSHTPKRYLHPPYAECMFTQWPTTMVLLGEIDGGAEPQHFLPGRGGESRLPSAGTVFLYREQIPDARRASYVTREDGIPIHGLVQDMGNFSLELESFCNDRRIPTAYTRVTLRNTAACTVEDAVTLLARVAPEFDLLGIYEPDGYTIPEPSANRWKQFPVWEHGEGYIQCYPYRVNYRTTGEVMAEDTHRIPNNFTGKDGIRFRFTLQPGECATIDLAFGRDESARFLPYEEARRQAVAFWEELLARIYRLPAEQPGRFRSLVAQGLQMLCYPKGCGYALLRQGGLQRRMWPTEGRSLLEALVKVGDYRELVEPILHTYFNVLQAKDGEIVNFGVPWAAVTGAVLGSFATAARAYPPLYEKYKENAYEAFGWMQAQRAKTADVPGQYAGLFPPAHATDYPGLGQNYGTTDVWNLLGYEGYAACLAQYNDPHAAEVIDAAADYRRVLETCVREQIARYPRGDTLCLPQYPGGTPVGLDDRPTDVSAGAYCNLIPLYAGLLGYNTPEAERLLRFHLRHSCNGLVMPVYDYSNRSGNDHLWYVNWLEYKLYFYYRRAGQDDCAWPLLEAQLKYSMTPENYLSERYDDTDPYFTPWCPNGSATGRTLLMLMDWYGLSE